MVQTVSQSSHAVRLTVGVALACVIGLAGCAGGGATGGDPGARALPAGQSCQSVKSELDRMTNSGVQSAVEAQSGGHASASQKVQADRYNQLLGQYLGARCHV